MLIFKCNQSSSKVSEWMVPTVWSWNSKLVLTTLIELKGVTLRNPSENKKCASFARRKRRSEKRDQLGSDGVWGRLFGNSNEALGG